MDGLQPNRSSYHHPAETYDDVLNRDSRPVPEFMREGPVPDLGLAPIPASNYFSQEYADREAKYLWPRIWQMVCREEEILNTGDYYVYELGERSLIVARTATGQIKAFHNVCLHRGRKLVGQGGCKSEFRCMFHGISWNIDGTLKDNPLRWDLPQWEGHDMSLPAAKVESWGGFVFVNMDLDAPPLLSVIGPMAEHFERYGLANTYKAMHVVKTVRCNWKVLAEAFMETSHASITHPQTKAYLADTNAQYDILSDYVSRNFSASGIQSPEVTDRHYSDLDIVRAMGSRVSSRPTGAPDNAPTEVPAGVTARAYLAQRTRESLAREDGHDYSSAADAEMIDSLLYNVWPNMCFWSGYSNVVFRWRPNGRDPDTSVMDVMILKRVPKEGARPKPVRVKELDIDEPFSAAPEMGSLGSVFDQDLGNLPAVQLGLHASQNGLVHFGRYSEMRIRKLHQMIEKYLAEAT